MTIESRLIALAQAIGTDVKTLAASQGALTALNTTAKSSLVAAINELLTLTASAGASIDDAAGDGSTAVTWSADKIFDAIEAAKTAVKNDLTAGASAAMDTLKELALEYPLFIVSNCQCGYIEVMMKGAGMEPYIKDFLCFGQTQTSKDQTILKLMEKNNLTNPVYVGDTQGDADSCKKAGVPFIFAEYGLGDVKEDYPTIHSFSELKNILRELD